MMFPKTGKRQRTTRKTKLRAQAAERNCQVMLDGCQTYPCVLAHVRITGISGMGIKAPDVLGAWACDHCHKAYDTRGRGTEAAAIELQFLRGVMRTLEILVSEGRVTVS